MKIIIERADAEGINMDLDNEAMKLDNHALSAFIEDAIHLLKCHLSNLDHNDYESSE